MSIRTAWLVFILMVVVLIFGPYLIARAEPAKLVYCNEGLCVMQEAHFDMLLELAKKAGKTCL